MKKFFLIFLLFLSACSSVLPSNEKDLADFVPAADEMLIEQGNQFAAENYPTNCEWHEIKKVVDGDTVSLQNGDKIRLLGIDTPETVHPNKPVEFYGPESSLMTTALLLGLDYLHDEVCLITDDEADKKDKYDRLLGYIFSEDGVDINAELLKTGHAEVYRNAPFSRKEEFLLYERTAKEADIGRWGE